MNVGGVIAWLVIGALAGWIAGKLMKGGGFGLTGNIIVGLIGAVLGGLVFDALNIEADFFLGSLITAVIGAVILLWLVKLFLLRKIKGK